MLERRLMLFSAIMLVAAILFAQGWWDSKPYTAWSKDEVQSMLDKSPWGILQKKSIEKIGHVRLDPLSGTGSGVESATDKLSFHVGLLTAKPIRMALARRSILGDPSKAQPDWGKYIDQEDAENIIVIVNMTTEDTDANTALLMSQALDNIQTDDLKARTFLATDAGKKVALAKYDHLGESGYGVKFYFPRNLPSGSPLVAASNKELRFETVISLPKQLRQELMSVTVSVKWDLKKMVFNGKPSF